MSRGRALGRRCGARARHARHRRHLDRPGLGRGQRRHRPAAAPARTPGALDAGARARRRGGDLLRARRLGAAVAGRRAPARSGRATASSTWPTASATPCGPATTGSRCWPSARASRSSSATCRARSAPGRGRRCSPSPGRIDLFPMDDAAEPLELPAAGRSARPTWWRWPACPTAARGDGRVRRDLGTRRRLAADADCSHVAVEPGRLIGAAPLPLGRGGAVRRARGRGAPAAGRRGARRCAAGMRRVTPAGHRPSRTPSGPAAAASSCWPTARAEPNDICYYPRSNKIFWPGVGVVGRIEHVDFWEGEEL